MIPEDFIYFSLNLTDSSINKLSDFISKHYTIQEVIKRKEVTGNFLHHCTLFYKNSCIYNQSVFTAEEIYNTIENEFEKDKNKIYNIRIIGWGWNNRALALLVDKRSIKLPKFINHNYHITICTFNNAKPFESNSISVWDIFSEPIEVECILTKNSIK